MSVRQGVKGTTDHWARSTRALKKEDRPYGERLVALARRHSSEAFYGCDDPLEAAVFSVLVEMLRQQDEQAHREARNEGGVKRARREEERDVDP